MLGFYKIVTFGCQMNIHESEKIAGMLVDLGYQSTEETDCADVIVFNTCCIRDNAEKRAIGNVGALKKLKKRKPDMIIAVCGCMIQQKDAATNLKSKFPFIDIVFGTHNLKDFKDFVIDYQSNKKKIVSVSEADRYEGYSGTIFRTSGTNAWVNIIYGCNNFCSYCIVPYVRGREISRNKEDVINDVKSLVKEGYQEITLLGQNVNSYGKDSGTEYTFADLLEELDNIEGKFRIRFMSSHPKDFSDRVIDVIANSKHICKSIHLPVQSGSSKVLHDMNRHYTKEQYLDIIRKIREKIPSCGISTDIMVGFPTETDEDLSETLDLCQKVGFISAFTFIYSPRKGTPAAAMEQIPEKIKKERIQKVIELQNGITESLSKAYIGSTVEVLCEDVNANYGSNVYCGRTDEGKLVNFVSDVDLIGQFVNIKVEKSNASVLWGVVEA